jgi:hypothetical protein
MKFRVEDVFKLRVGFNRFNRQGPEEWREECGVCVYGGGEHDLCN